MKAAAGFAVVEKGEIDVRTVSPTLLGATVNWLCVRKNMMLTRYIPEVEILRIFDLYGPENDASVVAVKIEEDTSID